MSQNRQLEEILEIKLSITNNTINIYFLQRHDGLYSILAKICQAESNLEELTGQIQMWDIPTKQVDWTSKISCKNKKGERAILD